MSQSRWNRRWQRIAAWGAGGLLLQATVCSDVSDALWGLSYSILTTTVENFVSSHVAEYLGVPSTGSLGLFGF
ncbi:MAG: hypothetical protein JXA69_05340 [Phycisphaerae bacterium]|nr:hypothetical protein [Phycisphaerae bacterium]